MVIPGVIKKSEDSNLELNPSTKQISISLLNTNQGPNSDSHIYGLMNFSKEMNTGKVSPSPPGAGFELCAPHNTFRYLPKNSPDKTNSVPFRFPVKYC